ncbi:MAG TPA: helix-turn-helix domain-containing protein [Gaiellaceae bacterium]|nr:helix-turn-helix domain-containing protein [Gaiellaceae bacterium]
MRSAREPRSLAVGSLLRESRKWHGYSRCALAERGGLSVDQLERWEILGVPIPPPKSFVAVAEVLGIPGSALDAALSGQARCLPRDPIEVYEAAPVIEDAIADQGWTPEAIAEALATSPTKVQAWRLGVVEMTAAERLMLSDLVGLASEANAEEA